MKLARHAQIIQLIHEYDIETQEELAEKLNASGFCVTQATVSRDIRQLKLTKVAKEDGHSKYAVLQTENTRMSEKYVRVLKAAFLSMDMAQNILVIKTVSGMANAAAVALEDMHFPEVVGCIAGDDTIMCAIRSADLAILVMDKINRMLEDYE